MGDRRELDRPPVLDARPDRGLLFCGAVLQRIYKRKGRFALGQVVPQVLAQLVAIGAVFEDIVDQLEGSTEVPAVARHGGLEALATPAQDGGNLRAGLEQLRGRAVAALE